MAQAITWWGGGRLVACARGPRGGRELEGGAYQGELVEVGEMAVFACCLDEGKAASGVSHNPVPFLAELLL